MKKIIIILTALLMVSCTGSRYSSDDVLEELNFEEIDSLHISQYFIKYNKLEPDSESSSNITNYFDEPLFIENLTDSSSYFKERIFSLLKEMPVSRAMPYKEYELIEFKKRYIDSSKIEAINIDSIYQLSRKERSNRNINANFYRITLSINSEDYERLSIRYFGDNIIAYGFCCTDYKSDILYRTFKGYTAFTAEYVLDIEFQKRFVGLFNDILTKYNETNGTDYPLLDVDYEVWSGIISAP
ncbi:MAG: hypothetical protein ACE364_00020 [Chlorobiota bacterium]